MVGKIVFQLELFVSLISLEFINKAFFFDNPKPSNNIYLHNRKNYFFVWHLRDKIRQFEQTLNLIGLVFWSLQNHYY